MGSEYSEDSGWKVGGAWTLFCGCGGERGGTMRLVSESEE